MAGTKPEQAEAAAAIATLERYRATALRRSDTHQLGRGLVLLERAVGRGQARKKAGNRHNPRMNCVLQRTLPRRPAPPRGTPPMPAPGQSRSSLAAVSPSMAARSASVRPCVPRMWSTDVWVHGYG